MIPALMKSLFSQTREMKLESFLWIKKEMNTDIKSR